MSKSQLKRLAAQRAAQVLTIDQALRVLTDAKAAIGGDKVLILSLSCSGIEDANINGMLINVDDDNRYVEVRCNHPSLQGEA